MNDMPWQPGTAPIIAVGAAGSAQHCTATVYAPDPQDCGDPATVLVGSQALCSWHALQMEWALQHQEQD